MRIRGTPGDLRRRRTGGALALPALVCAPLIFGWAAPGWGEQSTPAAAPAGQDVTIAVIADANGWISSLALHPEREPHGLAHLAGPLRALRRQYPGLVVVALGDWLSGAPAPGDATAALVRIAQALGIAAALPGDRDLLRIAGRPDSPATLLPWLAGDVPGLPAAGAHAVPRSDGLRLGAIGLARPGIVAATQLRRAGSPVRAAQSAASAALADLQGRDRADVTVALVNGGRDSQEDQATALAEGLPVRSGLSEWTGGMPVDLVIARGGGRQRASPTAVSVDAVPTVRVAPGLTVLHVSLKHDAGRWRVRDVARQAVAADPNPDAEILALAGEAWNRLAPWLAQPTRAVVSGYNRKADFMACAGELSHAAIVAAVGSQGGAGAVRASGAANAGPPLTLTPQLWRFEPLRKPRRGQAITRAQLYRWMPHDDAILPAQLTGRQIALLLEPYARHRSGWSVTPSWVLHPGGMEPVIPGRGTQPSGLAFAATGAALERQARYPVWMPAYHAYGAGGLARRALMQPDQLGKPLDPPLRELVFHWMAGPAFTVPATCAGFLALAPPH